jgi:hypothetical protein
VSRAGGPVTSGGWDSVSALSAAEEGVAVGATGDQWLSGMEKLAVVEASLASLADVRNGASGWAGLASSLRWWSFMACPSCD